MEECKPARSIFKEGINKQRNIYTFGPGSSIGIATGYELDCPGIESLKGGWALHDVDVKCRTLLYYRLWNLSATPESPTAAWLRRWGLLERQPNPPWNVLIPRTLSYLRTFAWGMVYVPTPNTVESGKDLNP
jgi:hypothetical protein